MPIQKKKEVLGFIGAGRAGRALAVLFSQRGYTVSSVIDTDIEKARRCQTECRAKVASTDVRAVASETTVLFTAVPDDSIERIGFDLVQGGCLRSGMVVVHTSGLLPAEVLSPVRSQGAYVCSFHPCLSFTEDFQGDVKDAFFAIEGDREGCRRLEKLATDLGGKPFIVLKKDKVFYHTACTIASNHLVTLLYMVQQLLDHIDEKIEIHHFLPLVRGTLNNIEKGGAEHALTGPILRGDIQTVEKHLEALKDLDADLLSLYIISGKATLRLAETLGLEPAKVQAFKRAFERYEVKHS